MSTLDVDESVQILTGHVDPSGYVYGMEYVKERKRKTITELGVWLLPSYQPPEICLETQLERIAIKP